MKILSAEQIRELDGHTIRHEPIASIDLMERASSQFVKRFSELFPDTTIPVWICAGTGNNGGDGLAIGRLLHAKDYDVSVAWCKVSEAPSKDCAINRQRLAAHSDILVEEVQEGDPLPEIPDGCLLIDGLFGSGLSRPVEGFWGRLIHKMNDLNSKRIAIDIPSGIFADKAGKGAVFQAHHTLSFQLPKMAFLFPENEKSIGKWEVLDIGLSPEKIASSPTPFHYFTEQLARKLIRRRGQYGHKGTYGHALLIMGSQGSVGAAILAGRACYRSGAGLVSLHAPQCAYAILQISLPEAMVSIDRHKYHFSEVPPLGRYQAIGVGCGLGQRMSTVGALRELLEKAENPMVIDADALNIIARNPDMLGLIPKGSILTPHPKEFERLFGPSPDSFAANELQREKARALHCTIILKGAHTCIAFPDGSCYFNSTGNPGMGTGGSGDVLTGILTGLLAQGYEPAAASLLGVYLHGLAGDLAVADMDQEALLAGDIIQYLGKAFRFLKAC